MVSVRNSELVPGMIVARNVCLEDGTILLRKGDVLRDYSINRLHYQGIERIYVEELAYSERIRSSQEFAEFCQHYGKEVDNFRTASNDLLQKDVPLDADVFANMVFRLLDGMNGNIPILDLLGNMKEVDDAIYAHSLNVALISNVLAHWLNWPFEKIKIVTVCGLFHDIGKLMVPQELIQKPDRLLDSEYQIVQGHALSGYQFLRGIDAAVEMQQVALMHHEKCDGSGYPLGLTREHISEYAKLVAIADVYDAMTSRRVYREALCPFSVVGMFEREGLQKYETEYILTFLEHVTNTYIQNRVALNNGEFGRIIMIQKGYLSRPLVQCGDLIIDLRERPELEIVGIL